MLRIIPRFVDMVLNEKKGNVLRAERTQESKLNEHSVLQYLSKQCKCMAIRYMTVEKNDQSGSHRLDGRKKSRTSRQICR